jgi:signal peptidase II
VRGLQERGPAAPLTRPRLDGPLRPRIIALATSAAVGVVAVDQLTKTWAVRNLDDGPRHLVWTLRLKLTFNSGGAFGLGGGAGPLIIVGAAVVALAALLHIGRRPPSAAAVVAIALVVGGAAGNLADRLFRDTGGAVVDFIDLQWWPVFNVADMAIVTGSGLLILATRPATRE